MLGLTVLVFVAMVKPAFCQEPAIDNDLIIYSMAVSPGQQVKFRLPSDMRSGDTISGSVVEESKNTSGKVNKTSSTLEGTVIEIDGKQTKISNRLISFLVPAGLTSLPFVLKNSAGEVIERGQIPIGIFSYFDTRWQEPVGGLGAKFTPQAVAQPGQTLRVTGSFDGNAANTNVSLSGQACKIIAESPRMSYVQVPQNAVAGVSDLTIQENNQKEEHKVNVVTLNLSANKTSLHRGEKATITVTVNGLENLDLNNNNFKIRLENQSPQTISFMKAGSNVITKELNAGSVKNGVYEFSTKVIAITTGVFTVSANLTTAADANECAKNYKDCVDAVDAKAKTETDKANASSNGTGALETIAKIIKWATEEKAKCLAGYLECTKK